MRCMPPDWITFMKRPRTFTQPTVKAPPPPRGPHPESGIAVLKRVPEAVTLAIATGFAYATGWLYDAGQLEAMGVPMEFAKVSISKGTLVGLFLTWMAIGIAGNAVNFSAERAAGWKKHIVILALVVVMILFLGIAPNRIETYQLFVGLATLVVAIASIGHPSQMLHILGAALVFSILGASFMGAQSALYSGRYTVIRRGSSEWILATTFENHLVCVPFDGQTLKAGPGFEFIDPTSEMRLTVQKVQPTFMQRTFYTPPATRSSTVPANMEPSTSPARTISPP